VLSIHPSYVEQFRRTLVAEGFRSAGLLQIWKRGQIFGYVRRMSNDLEWHVRAFYDGTLESELELPRTSIHHLLRGPWLTDTPLAELLRRYGIPFSQGFIRPSAYRPD
jgi:hypothetical protein